MHPIRRRLGICSYTWLKGWIMLQRWTSCSSDRRVIILLITSKLRIPLINLNLAPFYLFQSFAYKHIWRKNIYLRSDSACSNVWWSLGMLYSGNDWCTSTRTISIILQKHVIAFDKWDQLLNAFQRHAENIPCSIQIFISNHLIISHSF